MNFNDISYFADGYIREGDRLSMTDLCGHKGFQHEQEGDVYEVKIDADGFYLDNGCGIYRTPDEWFEEVEENCREWDEALKTPDDESYVEAWQNLQDDLGLCFHICSPAQGIQDEMLAYIKPSDRYKEDSILINALRVSLYVAVRATAKRVEALEQKAEAKPSKADKPKRAPALGFTLADLADALAEKGEQECYDLDFYILKKEGIKEAFTLEPNTDGEWVLSARDKEFKTLKSAFIWLNTDVRKEKNLKDITANCVGTKIMLSFIKFNGTTCDKFLNA
jgi:hypothetical protein